jgi:hypothetical protein
MMECRHREGSECRIDGDRCLASIPEDCVDYAPATDGDEEADLQMHFEQEEHRGIYRQGVRG